MPTSPAAAAERINTAALPFASDAPREISLPSVLSSADTVRYREIFRLQEVGEWSEADAEIDKLREPLLMGHVEAQRLLHKKYRARYDELYSWLQRYPEHPDARAVFELAKHRRPRGTKAPAEPVGAPVPLLGKPDKAVDLRPAIRSSAKELSAEDRGRAIELRAEIRRLIKSEPVEAEERLRGSDAEALLDASEADELRAELVESYLYAGEDAKALSLASAAKTPAYKPLMHWNAGLAAWRLGRLADARTHFEALARAADVPDSARAAAAYWTSRVHLRAKRPQLVNYWLGNAADYPRTFYGLIARRALGLDSYFDFESEPFTTRDAQTLQDYPAGRRALALLQVGQTARAEMEVRHLAKGAPPSVVPSLVALADRGGMPAVSLQLARQTGEGRRHDHAMFPMPRWEPKGGWMVDRALLFALMRQESEFLPHAESGAGARGLMQLMPSTAHAVAEAAGVALKDRKHVKGKPADKLLEPETNIALAQHYIGELMAHPGIRNNLLLLTAAYNSGPGTVAKWRSRAELKDDPLLFLELMPARETRVFVQRVLTNYWAYRTRLGQPAPELDALVEGRWPTYVSQDKLVVRNAAAR